MADAFGPAPRRLPIVVLLALALAGLALVAVGLRSPYTHANLGAGHDAAYVRTLQALLGADEESPGADAHGAGADRVARGALLYVRAGCAACHALEARGGVVGPRLAGIDAATVAQRVRQGPLGMPRFSLSGLSDEEVLDIAAYLTSLEGD